MPGALRAFAHRDFRLFFCGQGVSLIGTWMQSVAQSWLVLELKNSPFRLGLVGTLQFAPVLFLSFFAGALADRLPKRRLLIATQSLMCAQALVLAALVTRGHVQYWHVALMAAVYGLANTVDMPTRQAFIVEMVGRESLRSAIALNSTLFNGARVVGPALAGLVIARWGTGLAFFFNGVSFLGVIGALAMLHASGRPRPSTGRSLRGRGRPAVCSAVSAAITARKDSPLKKNASAVPQRVMTRPASAGPTTRAPLNIAEFSAIALRSPWRPTMSAMNAWRVGMSTVLARP